MKLAPAMTILRRLNINPFISNLSIGQKLAGQAKDMSHSIKSKLYKTNTSYILKVSYKRNLLNEVFQVIRTGKLISMQCNLI